MISITNYRGERVLLAPSAIATVTQASPSSQWHGIRAYIKLFDGKVIESGDTIEHIQALLDKASA